MADTIEHQFRTKTGSCVITPDSILLTREGAHGSATTALVGSSIDRVRAVYVVLGSVLVAYGAIGLSEGRHGADFVNLGVGCLLLWNAYRSRRLSAAPEIARSTIQRIRMHPPRPPFARGYIEVVYESEGRHVTRLIMLPGSLSGGKQEYGNAQKALQAAGLTFLS